MSTIEPQLIAKIQLLCQRALDDESLMIDEFYREWPKQVNAIPFFQKIYDDAEDGVCHMPGYRFKPGIDKEHWFDNSDVYLTIYLDRLLLNYYQEGVEKLSACREAVLKISPLSSAIINEKVAEFFRASKPLG